MSRTIPFVPLQDERILALCKECWKDLLKMGIKVPPGVKYQERKTTAWFGLASYKENSITLSSYILNDPEDELKRTIYHELAHLAANLKDPGCGHRRVWKDYAELISRRTGINITRTTNARLLGMHQEWVKVKDAKRKARPAAPRYEFVCPECGAKVIHHKKSKFVQQYDWTHPNGEPWWWCARCRKTTGKKIQFKKVGD